MQISPVTLEQRQKMETILIFDLISVRLFFFFFPNFEMKTNSFSQIERSDQRCHRSSETSRSTFEERRSLQLAKRLENRQFFHRRKSNL